MSRKAPVASPVADGGDAAELEREVSAVEALLGGPFEDHLAAAAEPVPVVRCITCQFFEKAQDMTAEQVIAAARHAVDRRGECHRYPTALRKSPEDWCGEWDDGKGRL